MNIIFMGTPEFAVPCLQCLLRRGTRCRWWCTQEDKPKGRGHQLAFPPVKEYALWRIICRFFSLSFLRIGGGLSAIGTGERPRFDCGDGLRQNSPAKGAGPAAIHGCINIHASPCCLEYRGAAPIRSAAAVDRRGNGKRRDRWPADGGRFRIPATCLLRRCPGDAAGDDGG